MRRPTGKGKQRHATDDYAMDLRADYLGRAARALGQWQIAMLILSLCDHSGVWSAPYVGAGYLVQCVDIQHGQDVRLLPLPTGRIHGVICQPPCTQFAASGAQWWKGKGENALLEGLSVVDACLRLVALCEPEWWVLENPVGRLYRYLGKPVHSFDPCEYAGYADNPDEEAYTKKTCLWGRFNMPRKCPVYPTLGSKMHLLSPGPERAQLRSLTPTGWARAFYEANP